MADPYQKCTCGCGQNLKHCASKAVLAELDAIDHAIAGNQRIAAISRIDNLLASEPNSTLLLSIKARIQIELSDLEGAKETVAAFEKLAPESPTMQVLRALTLAESDPDSALHSLLSAWEHREAADPQSLAFSVLIVSQSLTMNGNPAAALRLLETLQGDDEVVQRVRMQAALQEQKESVFVRLARVCDEAPSDHPLKEQLDAIDRAIYQLEWLRADQLLQEVAPKNPRDPQVLRRIGALLLLRKQEDAWAAWKHLAGLDTEDENERLFAEIVSILETPTDAKWMTDLIELTYPVDSLDAVMEKIVTDKHFYLSPQPPEPRGDGPPPRAQYFVLDRPLPTDADNAPLEEVPEMVGELTIFGKQTDAPARLVLQCLELNLEKAERSLKRLDAGLQSSARDVIGAAFKPDVETSLGLFMPPEFGESARERIAEEAQRKSVLELWPQTPHPALDGQTPAEAMKDESKRRSVNAMVVILETGSDMDSKDMLKLRESLGLAHEMVSADSVASEEMLRYDELTRLPLAELADDQLMNVTGQLSMFGGRLLGNALEVALERPALVRHERYRLHTLCEIAAKQSGSRLEAVRWLMKAADAAEARGDSAAEYLLAALVPAAMTQQEETLNQAMNRLTSKHINEPGVREGLMNFFQMIGFDPTTGRPMGGLGGPPPGEPSAAPAGSGGAESGLWTPDGGGPSGSAGGNDEGGGLWLPD